MGLGSGCREESVKRLLPDSGLTSILLRGSRLKVNDCQSDSTSVEQVEQENYRLLMSNTIRARLQTVTNQFVSQKRSFHPALPRMAKLDINSKLRMNSGHEIPMLGFGVYQT